MLRRPHAAGKLQYQNANRKKNKREIRSNFKCLYDPVPKHRMLARMAPPPYNTLPILGGEGGGGGQTEGVDTSLLESNGNRSLHSVLVAHAHTCSCAMLTDYVYNYHMLRYVQCMHIIIYTQLLTVYVLTHITYTQPARSQ